MKGARIRAAASSGQPATLELMGEVGWDFGPSDVARALKEAKGQPLQVDIFSYGGDAFAGLGIYQQLKGHDAPVTTRVLGVAASAASVIAMAGQERIVPENSAVMIHPSWSFTMGGADEHRKQADLLDKVNDALMSTYVEASGRPADEIRPYFDAESWLFGDEAFALGLSTQVGEPIEAMASVGEIPPEALARLPESVRNMLNSRRESKPVAAAPTPQARDSEPALGSLPSSPQSSDAQPMTVSAPAPNLEEARAAAREEERSRVAAIDDLCRKVEASDEIRDQLISSGNSIEEAQALLINDVINRRRVDIQGRTHMAEDGQIGMSDREIQNYSILRAIRHFTDPSDKRLRDEAGLELEASAAAIKASGRECRGAFRIPADVMMAQVPGIGLIKNAQTAGGFTSGGALIDTELLTGSMIELILNRLGLTSLNATVLSGLVGDIDIPRETSGPTHYWVNEGSAPPESGIGVGQLSLTPKTVGAKTVITRRLAMQTSISVEAWVRSHLSRKIALGIDSDFVYSPGGNSKPKGLIYFDGIGSVTLSGGTSKTIDSVAHNFGTYAQYVEAETKASLANLDVDSMFFLMSPHSRGILKTTLENANGDFYIFRNGQVNGYDARVTNQMQTNDTIFGDFSHAIVALWSGQDVGVNPYKYQDSGSIEISILQDCDFGIRYPEAFVYLT